MSNLVKHARRELQILEKVHPDAVVLEFKKEILSLLWAFAESGQSGGSAGYVANAITNTLSLLMFHDTLTPVTGQDHEWKNITKYNDEVMAFQNNRCYPLFKYGVDGRPYFSAAIQFKGNIVEEFTTNSPIPLSDGRSIKSCMYIKGFPFVPKTFVIDVIDHRFKDSEGTIPDPEGDYYLHTIKDESQLIEVFEYYDIMEEKIDPKNEEQNEEPII